jgi:hypothetical protein
MTERGTAMLVLLLAIVGGALWLAREPRPASAPAAPLLATPPAAVARVEVDGPGARLTAVRHGEGWTDPGGRPWHANAVADLVETLGTLAPIMVVDPDPHDPADYGLGPDATRLALSDTAGERLLALEVGERNPAATALYARLAGKREVVLVGAVLRWELEKVREGRPGAEP